MKIVSFIVSFVLGFVSAWLYELFAINILQRDSLIIRGWRLHHSLYGLLSIFIWITNKKTFFLGFGIGILAQHTVTDGFRFISR